MHVLGYSLTELNMSHLIIFFLKMSNVRTAPPPPPLGDLVLLLLGNCRLMCALLWDYSVTVRSFPNGELLSRGEITSKISVEILQVYCLNSRSTSR